MSRPKLMSVHWLRNHGVRVTYATTANKFGRFERPNGHLTAAEAARLLGMAPLQVYRLARAGRLSLAPKRRGSRRVSVASCRALAALSPKARRSVAGTAGVLEAGGASARTGG